MYIYTYICTYIHIYHISTHLKIPEFHLRPDLSPGDLRQVRIDPRQRHPGGGEAPAALQGVGCQAGRALGSAGPTNRFNTLYMEYNMKYIYIDVYFMVYIVYGIIYCIWYIWNMI